MKNILLTTTALATLFAGVAAASTKSDEGLSVTLGGEFEAQAGFRNQASKYLNTTQTGLNALNPGSTVPDNNTVFKQGLTPGNQNVAFDTVTAVHASVKNKTASGLVYGAQIGIQTTTRSQLPAGDNALDRTFIFVQNDMGRVELGSNNAVTSTMRTGADSIARATGGIDGQWKNYVNLSTFDPNGTPYTTVAVNSNNFILNPTTYLTNYQTSGTPSSTFMEGDEKSRKITYYTPEYNGFQAGLSYTPDTRNSGQDYLNQLGQNSSGMTLGQYNLPTAKNAVAAGVSWTGNFEKNQSLKISAVGETASVKANAQDQVAGNSFKSVRSGIVGAQYNIENFSVAGSYGNQGKSMYSNAYASSMKAGSFYTLGAAYVQGPVGASLTYMKSTQNKNTLNVVSLGVDYQVAPGLLPYAEVTYFTMKQKNAYTAPNAMNGVAVNPTGEQTQAGNVATNFKNSGTAFILGTRINF
jgi:hypothetical protein